MNRVALIALAGLCLATSAQPVVAQTPTLAGTWKLNVAKSRYSPAPMPRAESVTYEAAGQSFTYVVTATEADGSPTRHTGTLVFDGKDYPTSGSPDYDAVSTKQIDPYTGETDRKKNGKVVQVAMRVLSRDGKTMTLTTKGSNAKGQTIDNVGVYDRQ
jgi:hypothetical protein